MKKNRTEGLKERQIGLVKERKKERKKGIKKERKKERKIVVLKNDAIHIFCYCNVRASML